ncbi:MAG: methionine--tRNA ligase [Terriglobia bacterium]
MKRFYLTTPLYYPNARPHVGSAYTTIVCDVIARYKRMCGYDVAFLTGTDEHGEKLERAAAAAGLSPRDFVAQKRQLFIELWKKLGIEYSHFVYTDQADHTISVQRMLRRALEFEPSAVYKARYEGRYCVSDERYISDGAEPANCDICGRPAELISEENYFFRLSAFQDRLLELYEKRPEFVQPDFRRNEVLSFVKGGLRDISVSRRRIKWGIPWPDDPEQVFYVWYDALTGYMTGLGYAQGENGSAEFQKYWRNDSDGEIVHMIGKDILRFHAVYWPAFLMAARMPLPKTVFAHGWIYYEQAKMSKSVGNVVYPEPIIEALDSFGAPGNDALRYYLLREAPFGQDMSFSYDGLLQRYNSDLANDLGNLASRTVAMINRYFGGEVPRPQCGLSLTEEMLRDGFFGKHDVDENTTVQDVPGLIDNCRSQFQWYMLDGAVGLIWTMISEVNKYLAQEAPWKAAESGREEDRERVKLVLYTAADLLRTIAIMAYPVIPESSKRVWNQLGDKGSVADKRINDMKWADIEPGMRVGKPEPIFPRLDKEKTLAMLRELAEADLEREKPKEKKPMESETPMPPSPESPVTNHEKISIEDFAKVEMRVGEIKTAEPVAGAQKLLKLTVDLGTETRQVVAGIAEHYKPEQLIGMKVVIVANLQPRKLRGVESNGMIVAASVGPEGKPVLVTFNEPVEIGARLK